jgi:RNA polymerase sigma-70 factor (ECF subfamily)
MKADFSGERDDPPSPAASTLGDVLYSRTSRPLVAEAEWVALVHAVARGDQPALHGLYERAHRAVFTLAVRITANRETAEELTLDVFHDVWRRAHAYDAANGTVLGWIMNQARSRSIDRVRHDLRAKRAVRLREAAEPAVAEDASEELERKQARARAASALRGLEPAQRQAIAATFFEGLTHAEAATRLREPLGTIKTRIRAALRKLRLVMGMENS